MKTTDRAMTDWCLLFGAGSALVGKAPPLAQDGAIPALRTYALPMRFEPVFELQVTLRSAGAGRVETEYECYPVLCLGSIRHLDVPEGWIVKPLSELDEPDREQVRKAVLGGEAKLEGIAQSKSPILRGH
jgi:hypothetical protein